LGFQGDVLDSRLGALEVELSQALSAVAFCLPVEFPAVRGDGLHRADGADGVDHLLPPFMAFVGPAQYELPG
jgi:hypothetical protein